MMVGQTNGGLVSGKGEKILEKNFALTDFFNLP